MVRTNQQIVLDAYDVLVEDYQDICERNKQYIAAINKLTLKYIIGKKLIDIGSGDGRRISFLAKQANLKETFCLEPSKGMFEKLEKISHIKSFNICSQEKLLGYDSYFDVATSLWNVLGHIGDEHDLLTSINNIKDYLKPGGLFILDVNNRLNASAYGLLTTIYRFFIDLFFFKRSRGDVKTKWKIKGKLINGFGHIFAPNEIKNAIKSSGFSLLKVKYINYDNGLSSNNPFKGQIFIVAKKN